MGKTLKEYREDYYEASGQVSSITRQLAFAGIAILWLFKAENGLSIELPNELFFAAKLFVIVLGLDLFQYVYKTFVWGVFQFHHEKKNPDLDANLDAPSYFNWPTLGFFILKVTIVIWAYCQLLAFLNVKIATI